MIDSCLIYYSGPCFTGEFNITSTLEFFPVPATNMKKIIKICQMSTLPEYYYLNEFLEILMYLQEHSAFFSHRKHKMILDDIKVVQERLDKIGGLNHEH